MEKSGQAGEKTVLSTSDSITALGLPGEPSARAASSQPFTKQKRNRAVPIPATPVTRRNPFECNIPRRFVFLKSGRFLHE